MWLEALYSSGTQYVDPRSLSGRRGFSKGINTSQNFAVIFNPASAGIMNLFTADLILQ